MALKSNLVKRSQQRLIVLLICLVFIFGIAGYKIIEGLSFTDALFMTVITLSTVGIRGGQELTEGGKIFTIIFIISCLGVFAYAFSTLTSQMIEKVHYLLLKNSIKKSTRKKMKDHVIICGYGRNGQEACSELSALGRFCVIVNDVAIEQSVDHDNLLFIQGDATDESVLIKAEVMAAQALITTLPIDADNLYVVLTARSLNPKLMIISRASSESAENKLKVAGVNNVIMPEKVGGSHMATLVTYPDLVEFLKRLSLNFDDPISLNEVTCDSIHHSVNNKTLDEIDYQVKTGTTIIGLKTPDGNYILNPSRNTAIIPDSKLFVLGTLAQVMKLKDLIRNGL